ncbi:unnamed protein product, partial [Ectocarpus fasciculatus]
MPRRTAKLHNNKVDPNHKSLLEGNSMKALNCPGCDILDERKELKELNSTHDQEASQPFATVPGYLADFKSKTRLSVISTETLMRFAYPRASRNFYVKQPNTPTSS